MVTAFFLRAFTKHLQKACMSFAMSVRPHEITRLPKDWLATFIEICWNIPVLVRIGLKYQTRCLKTYPHLTTFVTDVSMITLAKIVTVFWLALLPWLPPKITDVAQLLRVLETARRFPFCRRFLSCLVNCSWSTDTAIHCLLTVPSWPPTPTKQLVDTWHFLDTGLTEFQCLRLLHFACAPLTPSSCLDNKLKVCFG